MKNYPQVAKSLLRNFVFLMVTLITISYCCPLIAKEAPQLTRAGTYLQINGDPMQIAGSDMLSTQVFRKQDTSYVKQYYSSMEVYLRLNGATYTSRNSNFTSVSNTKTADTIDGIVTVNNVDGVRLRQQLVYIDGSSTYQHIWTMTNTGTTTYTDVSFLYGGDTYFAGDDDSQGHWDPRLKMVYLSNPNPNISGIMGLYGAENSPPDHYYEGGYSAVWSALSNGALPDTIDVNYQDAGYALQWNRASFAPGDTWTIVAYEKWTNSGFIQVLAPAAKTGNSGTKVTYQFTVQNLRDTADTCALQAISTLGWTTTLPGGAAVTIPANSAATVTVELTIPYNAATGTKDTLKLVATSAIEPTKPSSDLVVTTAFNPPLVFTNIKATPQRTTSAISWTSDELSSSQVKYGTTTAYGSISNFDGTNVTSHLLTLTGLTPGTLYHYQVRSKDNAVDETISGDYTFTTKPPLIFSNIVKTPRRLSAVLTWTTNDPSTSLVEYGTTTGYGASTVIDTQLVTNHSVTITGLTAGTGYHFKLHSKDIDGYESFSGDGSFTTKPPLIFSSIVATSKRLSAVVTWTTNDPSTSLVEYGTTTGYGTSTVINSQMVTNHSVTITGLTVGTGYHFKLHSKDTEGSESLSADGTFSTKPPLTFTNIVVTPDKNSALVTWSTAESATTQVEYGTTTTYGATTTLNTQMVTSHSATINGLVPATTYHYRLHSKDEEGYDSISGDATFLTLPAPDLQVTVITPPVTVFIGSYFDISWTDKNAGPVAASGNWVDQVFLSSDNVVGGDTLIGEYTFTDGLASGASIVRTQSITLASAQVAQGNYYIIVVTDARNTVIEKVETNNSKVSTATMTVKNPPRPDLIIDAIDAPTSVFSGQKITVQWTVKNQGTGATNDSLWYDQVFLSLDQTIGASDNWGTEKQNVSYLRVGESYVASADFVIPIGYSGTYYIIGATDNRNYVVENLETNNSKYRAIQIQLTPPPDLQVTTVSAPDTGWSGQPILVNWSVENKGTGPVPPEQSNWRDGIYLSLDETLDITTDKYIGSIAHAGALAVNESYVVKNQSITLPASLSGNYFLFVVADRDNQVYEHATEGNNSNYDHTAIRITLAPPADLLVTTVTSPAAGTAGRNIAVSWTVENQGGGDAVANGWYDGVYLSQSTTFSLATATKIAQLLNLTPLPAGIHYTQSADVTLPDQISGPYYIFVITDIGSNVPEYDPGHDAEANNTKLSATTLQVTLTPPDLQLSSVSARTPATAGQPLVVNWTVKNVGTGATLVSNWIDYIYYSTSSTFDISTATRIGDFAHAGVLNVNSTYTQQQAVNLPVTLNGAYYIYVYTDGPNQVAEATKENNNTGRTPGKIQVNSTPPDLQVTAVTAPATAKSAQLISVEWSVQNLGTGPSVASSWKDQLYLSLNKTLETNTDILLDTVLHTGALEVNGSYSGAVTVKLPQAISGTYYLLALTNCEGSVFESNSNNNLAFSAAMQVTLASPVDLVVSTVSAPATALAGQPMNVSWKVTNSNTGTTDGDRWYDVLYLSKDQVFDSTDTNIGTFEHIGTLAAAANYTRTMAIDMPREIFGPYYLFVVTDANNKIYEVNEQNNTGFDTTAVQVDIPLPSDLVVNSVTCAKTSGLPGQSTTFNWTVKNIGANPAIGTWYDSVYLSVDDEWDITDPLLGYVRHDGNIAVNGSYNATLTAPLPGVTPNAYRILVRTDIRNNVNESDELHNYGLSITSITMDATELTLGNPVTIPLTNGSEFYYKVKVGSDLDLRVTLDSLGLTGNNELFVRAMTMPDRGHYDAMYSNLFSPDQEVQISGTQAGWYYLLVRANNVPGTSVSATVLAQLINFSARMAIPSSGSNRGLLTTRIMGAKFTKTCIPSLVAGNGTKTAGTKVWCKDRAELWATFDLRGLAVGSYSLQIVDGANVTTLANAFTVTNGPVGKLEFSVRCTPSVRPGQQGVVSVDYTNTGETDIVAPWFVLTSDNGRFQLPTQNGYHDDNIELLGINYQGPAGVLPPGSLNSITMNFLAKVTGGGVLSNIKLQLAAPDTVTLDWAARTASLKPEGIPTDAWNALFSNFSAEMGTTLGQANAVIAESARYLSQLDTYTPDFNRLLAYKLNLAGVDGDIRSRYQLGVFGRGFPAIMDMHLRVTSSGNVSIAMQDGNRLFFKQADGSYRGITEDSGKLTLNDGSYQLLEANGISFTFSTDGRLLALVDGNGNRTSANYTGMRMTGMTDSNGDTESYTYNAAGRITQIADRSNRLTKYTYDASNEHLLKITMSDGQVVSYTYVTGLGAPCEHAVSTTTNSDATHAYYSYDSQGRLTKIMIDGNKTVSSFSYDANGKLTVTDALGAETTYFTNEFGVAQIWDELGRVLRYLFDEQGHVIAEIGPYGVRTSYSYDTTGQITEMFNPLNHSVKIAYDPNNYLVRSVTDMRGNITSYTYDERGNLLTMMAPDGNFDTRAYDTSGNLLAFTNQRNRTTTMSYDARNQLSKRTYTGGAAESFTYNADGDILTATNSNGTTTMVYDTAGRLKKITYPSGKFLAYTFDAVGRRTQMVDQGGFTVKYSYDAAGHLQKLSNAANQTLVSYIFDNADQVIKKTLGNGAYTTYQYDLAGQLLHQINYTSAGVVISRFDYTYDDLGRQIATTTSLGSWAYSYDAAGQLLSAEFSSLNPATVPNQTISYSYDAAGNRMQSVVNGTTTDYATNVMNQYTAVGADSPSYDADGNLLTAIADGSPWSFIYDDENRIVSGTNGSETLSYEYDALGNRIAMVKNGQRYECLVDPVGIDNVVAMYDGSGAVAGKFIYGFGLVGQLNALAKMTYYTFDAQGNTSELLSATGTVLNRYAYQPFGERIFSQGTAFNPYTFSGEAGVIEDGLGLFYMRMRNYNSLHGRFMQADPLGFDAGYNQYSYAKNDPNDWCDPTGLDPWVNPWLNPGEMSALDKAYEAARKIFTPGNFKIPPGAGTAAEAQWLNTIGKMTNAQLRAAGISPDLVRAAELAKFNAAKAAQKAEAKLAEKLLSQAKGRALELAKRAPKLSRLSRFGGWIGRGAGKVSKLGKPILKVFGKLVGKAFVLYTAYEVGDTIGTVINDYALTDEQKELIGEGTYLTLSREGLGNAYDYWFGWLSGPASSTSMLQVRPRDPNEKRGPVGFGPAAFVGKQQILPYTIFFENVATAGAPAHRISVVDKLSTNLDARTFRLGEIIFGDHKITVPENRSFYQTRIPLGPEHGNIEADITAGLDIQAGEVFWIMTAIDPETGEQPIDPMLGLLPPNDAAHSGEGHVTFTIKPKATAVTGATIVNKAAIVFDTNETIETNVVTNTIDAVAPVSKVSALPASSNVKINVSWSGTDDSSGSGIATYTIYYTDNGGAWTAWLSNTTAITGIFSGVNGHVYQFYSIAQDGAGNTEAAPAVADTTTTAGTAVNNPPVAVAQNVWTNKGVAKAIILSATDAEYDTISYTVLTQPTHGILAGTAPTLNYTPTTGYAGADSFTFKVNDGKVDSAPATVSITVNTPPLAKAQSVKVNKNTSKTIVLSGSDVDGNPLSFTVLTPPAHGVLKGTAPTLIYTPATGYSGADSFTFKANDGMADSTAATVSIIVNSAPLAAAQSVTISEDIGKTIILKATDADGNTLTYSVVTPPAHGTLTGTAPNVIYKSAPNYNGADTFTFKANDGTIDSNIATVTITVSPVNDPPVAATQSVSVTEDVAKTIVIKATDVEGSALTYTVVTQPAHGTITGTAPTLKYAPAANYNGPDSFTFKAKDGLAYSNIATVTITVTPVNDAPVAAAQSVTIGEDIGKTVSLKATDADGNTLTYSVVTPPAHGTLTGTAPNVIYKSAPNYNGPDTFTFKANDGTIDSNIATVTITVSPVNDAPVAATQSVSVTEDVAKTIVIKATDVEGSALTYTVVTQPAHGKITGTAPTLKYAPAANYNGPDSFTFKAKDGLAYSNIATVTITVTPVNDAPLATAQSIVVNKGVSKAITLSGTDVEGSALTYTLLTQPAHGKLAGTAPTLTYTPAAEYTGEDSFTFKVKDGTVYSVAATVTIIVALPLTKATLTANYPSPQSVNKTITLTATTTGGAKLQYQFLVNGAVVRDYLTANTFLWKPTIAGTYTLTTRAKDPNNVVVTSSAVTYSIQP